MARMTRTRVAPAEEYDETSPAGFDSDTQDEIDANPYAAPEMKRSRMRRPTGPISSGWGAPAAPKRETVKAPFFRASTKKAIIKLLEAEPGVRFRQHYVKPLNQYHTCIEVIDKKNPENNVDCPLCDAGHKPSVRYMMNIVEMAEDTEENYVTKTWTFGPEVAGHLQAIAEDIADNDRIPDEYREIDSSRWYFKVYNVTGENNRTSNKVEKIKASDLPDEFGIEPLNDEEIAVLRETMYDDKVVWISSDEKMRQAAKAV